MGKILLSYDNNEKWKMYTISVLFGLPFWMFHFKIIISKQSFPNSCLFHHHLDVHFIWKFKFLHSILIYFKITISKNITLLFPKQSYENSNPNRPLVSSFTIQWIQKRKKMENKKNYTKIYLFRFQKSIY